MDITYVLHMRKLLRLPSILNIFDQFSRIKTSAQERKEPDDNTELTSIFAWHAILSSALMMVFLRLDSPLEAGSDKHLGQVTDWGVGELISLMEIVLEECTDDLEGLKTKPHFTSLALFKSAKTTGVLDQPDTKCSQNDHSQEDAHQNNSDPYSMMYQ